MINESDFCREATLKICSTFEVEQSLKHCFDMLAQHMPIDVLYLSQYQEDLLAMRFIASARRDSCSSMDTLLRLPEIDKKNAADMDRIAQEKTAHGVVVFNRCDEMPMNEHILDLLDLPPSSAMSLPLMIADQWIGSLDLFAHGQDHFNGEHIRLFATLREPMALAMANSLKHRELLQLKNLLVDDNKYLQRELLRLSGSEIVGADFGLREVMRQVGQVAPTESPVLLSGETGVGKDVIANAIHLGSQRREGPFIPVNCGAIPDSLLDSELFGHEKGAFTGALSQKRGRFERANKGTILLDEIGEMPLEAQVRLLRVLQNREIERIGGTKRISLDIRIIAATNKDLTAMVKDGRFREDLYFRLNVFPIRVPPLRDRTSDIPALVQHFVESKARELKVGEIPQLAEDALDVLMAYHWPGNVRELQNVVERAMILHQGESLRFDDLGLSPAYTVTNGSSAASEHSLTLDDVIVSHIKHVLDMTEGKIHGAGGAGELLGINPSTLRTRMKKLGIPFKKG
ncbi:MAG: sigma 54-interacting transcriptional regulator [Myxococcota bacterium]|nr:sigma 54-interacting transcriptional regulator [Myxococcota bacterium]